MRLGIGLFLYALGGLLLWYLLHELAAAGPFTQELLFVLFVSQVSIVGYIIYKGYFD